MQGITEPIYVYVIETNLLQRSFAELLPSEKAAVLVARYEKISSQGKRNDIRQEIMEKALEGYFGKETPGTYRGIIGLHIRSRAGK